MFQAADNSASVARLTTELSTVSAERDELSRQVFTARAEREDMVNLAERRQAEVTRAGAEIRSLTEEVARAQTAKVRFRRVYLVKKSIKCQKSVKYSEFEPPNLITAFTLDGGSSPD